MPKNKKFASLEKRASEDLQILAAMQDVKYGDELVWLKRQYSKTHEERSAFKAALNDLKTPETEFSDAILNQRQRINTNPVSRAYQAIGTPSVTGTALTAAFVVVGTHYVARQNGIENTEQLMAFYGMAAAGLNSARETVSYAYGTAGRLAKKAFGRSAKFIDRRPLRHAVANTFLASSLAVAAASHNDDIGHVFDGVGRMFKVVADDYCQAEPALSTGGDTDTGLSSPENSYGLPYAVPTDQDPVLEMPPESTPTFEGMNIH